jgi:hypothetical protein
MLKKLVLVALYACLALSRAVQAETVIIGDFSAGDLTGWEEKSFSGETQYSLVEQNGVKVLAAHSDGTASGYVKKVKVNLAKTPILNWSWKTENILPGLDEKTKQGDDYPVRIYVVFSGGLFFWKTRALNYVWSNRQPIGAAWPNAFTSHAMMIAVESGKSMLGQWVHYKRNVRKDFKRYFGTDQIQADAVALMTDTDNSGLKADSYYGNIYFTDK